MANLKIENEVVVGNVEDKANLKNPIGVRLVEHFDATFFRLLDQVKPESIHEVGCGEGRLVLEMHRRKSVYLRGTDISEVLIPDLKSKKIKNTSFETKSIYDLEPTVDHADVIVCCEVLEHLDDPVKALRVLHSLGARKYILSVPREPIWRILNMARLKYLPDFGNTPGHFQNWSSKGFVKLLETNGFRVETIKKPLPWTMVVAETREY